MHHFRRHAYNITLLDPYFCIISVHIWANDLDLIVPPYMFVALTTPLIDLQLINLLDVPTC
jgi:hypothetical protein